MWLPIIAAGARSSSQQRFSVPSAGSTIVAPRLVAMGVCVCLLQLSVRAQSLSIAGQPQSQTVTALATATFSVTAAGSGSLSYQWYKNWSSHQRCQLHDVYDARNHLGYQRRSENWNALSEHMSASGLTCLPSCDDARPSGCGSCNRVGHSELLRLLASLYKTQKHQFWFTDSKLLR